MTRGLFLGGSGPRGLPARSAALAGEGRFFAGLSPLPGERGLATGRLPLRRQRLFGHGKTPFK
jgi:hypothetical protein